MTSGVRAFLYATLLTCFLAASASAENAKVFGIQAPPQGVDGAPGGAFIPSGTNLACSALRDGQCWDGGAWHHLYPSGPRHYAHGTGAQVACVIIIEPRNDCWTGTDWYRLPSGQLFGVIAPPQGRGDAPGGAFLTVPLP
jgi:hypothetical protein